MRKATFDSKQETTKFMTVDGRTTVQICMNGEEVQREQEDGTKVNEYVYDFNEFTEENPDIDAIKANPENYLDYSPAKAATAEERIESLEDAVDAILVATLEA